MASKRSDSKATNTTAGNFIRKLVTAHARGDQQSFRKATTEFISEERRKNHNVLADDLERLLGSGGSSKIETLTLLRTPGTEVPRDKERGIALLDVFEPSVALSEMIVNEQISSSLIRVILEQRRKEVLSSFGLAPIRKILFCGPPGCGKTMAAEAIAKELYLPLMLVRFDAIISSYLGETAANLRRVFDFANSRPMVLLFDEFDAIGKKRDDAEEHGELKRVVNAFLQMMDSFNGDAITIAATNHEDMLDPALWRRFDDVIVFSSPSIEQIRELLARHLRHVGILEDVELATCAQALAGSSHAEVKRVAQDAVKLCLLKDQRRVSKELLDEAVQMQKQRMKLQRQLT